MAHEKKPRRKYELKKRAAMMAQTRRRIAKAAAELHGTIGPARTSLSAVAQRAGVQRHTVYRHFPTEAELFGACSAHFFSEHPLPDVEPWREIRDPHQRLQRALSELYAYYKGSERMLGNVLRDAELIEDLRPTLVPMQEYLNNVAETLARGWSARGRRRQLLAAATRHAIDFRSWRSLTAEGRITRAEAIELAIGLVEVAAGARSGATT
jgi:AcrR family transcriptional regulator